MDINCQINLRKNDFYIDEQYTQFQQHSNYQIMQPNRHSEISSSRGKPPLYNNKNRDILSPNSRVSASNIVSPNGRPPLNVRESKISGSNGENIKINATSIYNYPINTIEQKKKTLQKYKYINQLARLEYQDKVQEVYTKYTRQSKVTVMKKIKARNQIAQFQEEEEDENVGYDELLEFKFGKEKESGFHFQKNQIKQYDFCEYCDNIHNDHPQAHQLICDKKKAEDPQLYNPYSQIYIQESLKRINAVVSQMKSSEYEQLAIILREVEKMVASSRSIFRNKQKIIADMLQLMQNNKQDAILTKIIKKLQKLLTKV